MVGVEPCPSSGKGRVSGCVWGVCELSMTLSSLSAVGLGRVPVLLVVWPEASSTRACKQVVELGHIADMGTSGRAHGD